METNTKFTLPFLVCIKVSKFIESTKIHSWQLFKETVSSRPNNVCIYSKSVWRSASNSMAKVTFFLVMMTHEGTDIHISDLTLERKLRHGTNGITTRNVLTVMEHFSPTSLHYYICIKVCFYSVVSSLSSNYCEL